MTERTRRLLIVILAVAMMVMVVPAAAATTVRAGGSYTSGTCYGTYYGSTTWIGSYTYSGISTSNYTIKNGVESWKESQTKYRYRTTQGCLNSHPYRFLWIERYYRTRWGFRALFLVEYSSWSAWS
jgi:hypothetical protein